MAFSHKEQFPHIHSSIIQWSPALVIIQFSIFSSVLPQQQHLIFQFTDIHSNMIIQWVTTTCSYSIFIIFLCHS